MGTVYCDNCGTSLLEETAKFCRACGKPTPLSEAVTKKFDEPSQSTYSSTRPVSPSYTGPAYLGPLEPAPAVPTNDLRQNTQKRNLIIIGSMFAVMILALAGLMIFFVMMRAPDVPPPPGGPVGSAPGGIQAPPPPPPPPGPPGSVGQSIIDSSLIYPGARQTMSVNQEGGKGMIQLTSDDAASTVADWYLSRLKNVKKVTIIGQTILKSGDTTVMVMGADSGSQIIITKGGD